MDGYAQGMPTQMPNIASQQSVRKQTPAERVRDDAERAVTRLHGILAQVGELKTRLCGAEPSTPEKEASDLMRGSGLGLGFIGGTGSAVERVHISISEIETMLSELSQVV